VPATAPNLGQFLALRTRRYAADGFTGGVITQEAAVGSSAYHGGAVELLHRFSRGLMLRANYTFAKTMDNSTNDLNTSAVESAAAAGLVQSAQRVGAFRAGCNTQSGAHLGLRFADPNWSNRLARGAAAGWNGPDRTCSRAVNPSQFNLA